MATLVVYPDPGTGLTTVDGDILRTTTTETFATIIAGAGTSVSTAVGQVALTGSSTTNEFAVLKRDIWTFSTLGVTGTVTAVTLSLALVTKSANLGQTGLDIIASTPASNNALVAADFQQFGTTSFANIDYATFENVGAYNDITLNSSGIAAVVLGTIVRLGGKLSWDFSGSFTGTWVSSTSTSFNIYDADNAGTTLDPQLTITYTPPPPVVANPDYSRFPKSILAY